MRRSKGNPRVCRKIYMQVKQTIAKLILRLTGWDYKQVSVPPESKRCMLVYAPHTSNWDWFYGTLHMIAWGLPLKVVIKNAWLKFPFGLVLKPLGAIGITRDIDKKKSKKNQVYRLASVFKDHEEIAFVITPEGTRSPRDEWKTGFYHIAKLANVPIVLISADAPGKKVWFGPTQYPSDDLETVMRNMMDFYKTAVAFYPENFKLDKRYSDQ